MKNASIIWFSLSIRLAEWRIVSALSEMIEEALTACPHFACIYPFCIRCKARLRLISAWRRTATRFHLVNWDYSLFCLRLICWRIKPSRWLMRTVTIAPVNRDLMKVGSTQPDQLCICVRGNRSTSIRVVGEINTRYYIPDMKATFQLSAKKLSGLRFKVILPMRCTGTNSSGMIFSRIQQIEIELEFVFLGH